MARGPYVYQHEGIRLHTRRVEQIDSRAPSVDLAEQIEALKPEWALHPRRHCRFEQQEYFFGEGQAIGAHDICPGCPVIGQCLAHAISNGEYGAWGGTTDTERRYMR